MKIKINRYIQIFVDSTCDAIRWHIRSIPYELRIGCCIPYFSRSRKDVYDLFCRWNVSRKRVSPEISLIKYDFEYDTISLRNYFSYRLRRVFRKTINIADNVFKTPNILEEAIIPQIVRSLGSTYPELERNYEQILKVVTHEADEYRSLLERSSKKFRKLNLRNGSPLTEIDALENPGLISALNDIEKQLKSNRKLHALSSENLYYLYKTYGLHEDTLVKVAQEKHLTVHMDEFMKYRNEQNKLSKRKMELNEKPFVQELKRNRLPKTDDSFKYYYKYDADTKCYELPTLEAKVLHVGKDAATDLYHIVLDRTNFYAMAGGQDSDVGEIVATGKDRAVVFEAEMVELINDVVVHSGHFQDAAQKFKIGDLVNLCVNSDRRTPLTQHHTGIMNWFAWLVENFFLIFVRHPFDASGHSTNHQ